MPFDKVYNVQRKPVLGLVKGDENHRVQIQGQEKAGCAVVVRIFLPVVPNKVGGEDTEETGGDA